MPWCVVLLSDSGSMSAQVIAGVRIPGDNPTPKFM
jgi:hypothetical protein